MAAIKIARGCYGGNVANIIRTERPTSKMTNEELLKFYDEVLPFKDLLSMEAGEVEGAVVGGHAAP